MMRRACFHAILYNAVSFSWKSISAEEHVGWPGTVTHIIRLQIGALLLCFGFVISRVAYLGCFVNVAYEDEPYLIVQFWSKCLILAQAVRPIVFVGLFTIPGFPRPDCIIDVSDELGAENKTWINKLKQWAKRSSFLKGTRGPHYLAMLEIISFVQLKFPPSVAIWHNNASSLLPKSLVHLMAPENLEIRFGNLAH